MQASIAIAKKTPEQRLKLDIALALHLGPNYGKVAQRDEVQASPHEEAITHR